jgi:drug/metabolite transporter (DMT)-like permease
LAFLLAVAAAASWGVAMTVAKPGSRHLDPVTFLLTRWILALILAVLVAGIGGTLVFPSWDAIGLVVLGSFMNAVIGWTLYLLAMERAPGYRVTALASTAPLWGVLGAILFVGEPFHWAALVAALLVIAGAYFLVRERSSEGEPTLSGAVLAIVAGILWGVSESVPMNLATQRGMPPETSIIVFAIAAIAGNALLMPLLRRRIPSRRDRRGLWLAALSAVSGAFLGWFLWLNGLRLAPASLLAPVRGSTLLFTFVFSVLFLRERPSRWAIIGVALVFGGVLLVSLGT